MRLTNPVYHIMSFHAMPIDAIVKFTQICVKFTEEMGTRLEASCRYVSNLHMNESTRLILRVSKALCQTLAQTHSHHHTRVEITVRAPVLISLRMASMT